MRGKLLQNVLEGTDSATQSLKMLGQDRRVNMFAPESTSGYVIIEMPPRLPSADDLPVLDGEIVQTPALPPHQPEPEYLRRKEPDERWHEAQEAEWRAMERNRKSLPEP